MNEPRYVDGKPVVFAERGRGASCLVCQCGAPFGGDRERGLIKGTFEGFTFDCMSCGRVTSNLFDGQWDVLAHRTSRAALTAEGYDSLTHTWWHGTTRHGWEEGDRFPDVMVHLGTQATAKWMMRWQTMEARRFFKVRLTVPYSPVILRDFNNWPDLASECDEFALNPDLAHRYVNRYEVPGSVSILVQRQHVEVLDGAFNPW